MRREIRRRQPGGFISLAAICLTRHRPQSVGAIDFTSTTGRPACLTVANHQLRGKSDRVEPVRGKQFVCWRPVDTANEPTGQQPVNCRPTLNRSALNLEKSQRPLEPGRRCKHPSPSEAIEMKLFVTGCRWRCTWLTCGAVGCWTNVVRSNKAVCFISVDSFVAPEGRAIGPFISCRDRSLCADFLRPIG